MGQGIRKVQLSLYCVLFLLMILLTLGVFGMDHLTERENFQSVVDNSTFAHYDQHFQCTFLQCMFSAENRYVVISAQGNGFYDRVEYFLILGTIIAAALYMLYSHAVHTSLRNLGIPLTLIGLLAVVPSVFPVMTLGGVNVQGAVQLFFHPIIIPLLVLLVIGLGLILSGYILGKRIIIQTL